MVTGSLFERNGTYTAVLNTYENGKRKQKSIALGIPVKGNKRKALEMLEELKRFYNGEGIKDLQIKKDSPLFADFLKDWLKITAPTIERTTYQSYESMIDARLDGFFRMHGRDAGTGGTVTYPCTARFNFQGRLQCQYGHSLSCHRQESAAICCEKRVDF